MSGPDDGAGRQDDIIIIKQLLQKLEEAAQREADQPQTLAPPAEDESAKALSKPDAENQPAEQTLQLAPEERPDSLPHDQLLMSLTRGRSSSRPDDASSTELIKTPIAIDLLPSQTAVATIDPAVPAKRRPGFAIAAISFALGIIAAGGLILVLDPFRYSAGSSAQKRGDDRQSVALAPTGAATPQVAASPPSPEMEAPAKESPPERSVTTADRTPSPEPASSVIEGTGSTPAARGTPAPSTPPAAPTSVAPPTSVATAEPLARPAVEHREATQSANTAKLQLPSRIVVRAGERQTLDVAIAVADAEQQRLLVVFRRMPSWLSLSKGGAIANGIWLLPAPQVVGVELEAADTASGQADVQVQLARSDGTIVVEATLAVQAISAAPSTAPPMAAIPGNESTILRLQARGEFLLDTGEIEAARTLLRTAAEAGSVSAALRLAETYDPAEMQRLGMAERTADVAQAARWYEHAQALGSPVAASRLTALGRR